MQQTQLTHRNTADRSTCYVPSSHPPSAIRHPPSALALLLLLLPAAGRPRTRRPPADLQMAGRITKAPRATSCEQEQDHRSSRYGICFRFCFLVVVVGGWWFPRTARLALTHARKTKQTENRVNRGEHGAHCHYPHEALCSKLAPREQDTTHTHTHTQF
jgi:hypothetical protein